MCSRDLSLNNNVIIADGTDNNRVYTEEECVCLVHKKTRALIRFRNIDFNCIPPRAWQLEFYYDGCLERTLTCDSADNGEFFIPYESTVTHIHIRLKEINPSSQESGSYYYMEVMSTAEDICKYVSG